MQVQTLSPGAMYVHATILPWRPAIPIAHGAHERKTISQSGLFRGAFRKGATCRCRSTDDESRNPPRTHRKS